ncbi:hypothetical protein [Streptomyces sp. NPDC101150]|uniref:hypothetical protein n=1 Tax=Streptomyces sp. NPDC101150 TaxID=3366114 RepID=UPI00380E68F3
MDEANEWLMGNADKPARRSAPAMAGLATEIAGRVKELFYAYDNRKSADNRSAQAHLGPSEIGTPCDRRIAMSLMQVPPVNPGGDGWAAFVGTCIHAGLADMFRWADHGTGRYATEMPLTLPSVTVPKGTGDLLDRTMLLFADHKCMGNSSLSKLRLDGPSNTYRVQVHTYAYAAIRDGEHVEHVAIVAWPREASSLKGLHVWTEPYDESIALAALARAEDIAARAHHLGRDGNPRRFDAFTTADDCRFCPFKTNTAKGCKGHAQ